MQNAEFKMQTPPRSTVGSAHAADVTPQLPVSDRILNSALFCILNFALQSTQMSQAELLCP